MSIYDTYRVGELVNVAIMGARVMGIDDVGLVRLSIGNWQPIVNLRTAGVTVTRVAPADWPPRAGDVWNDNDQDELPGSPCDWHVLPRRLGDDELVMHVDSSSPGITPSDFIAQYPAARLVRRREPGSVA